MVTTSAEIKNHKELLCDLIAQLETSERSFYERTSHRNYWAWHITAGIAFLSSIVSALVAALIDSKGFEAYGKVLLVVVPVVGAGAAGLLHLYKFREKEALREEGRIEVNDIIANAKSLLALAATDDDFQKAFHSVHERFVKLEQSQHRRDIALRSDEIPKLRQ
jgi:uncharacterized membrane protein YgaE (UPF0421/DUF939 family)